METHMKSQIILLALCLSLAAVPAMAQGGDIYDNGPTTGNAGSWALDGYPTVPVVSDSFTVTTNGTWIEGFNFLAWVNPGYDLAYADLSITSQENGGTVYLDQNFQFYMYGCTPNNYGYDLCTFSTGFAGPTRNAGTYWVNLTSGETQHGWPLYWDENSGPSLASQDQVGTIPSESFTVFGEGGSSTSPDSVPEPSSISLVSGGGVAILGFLGALRRKRLQN
jgi:hypothetical protein